MQSRRQPKIFRLLGFVIAAQLIAAGVITLNLPVNARGVVLWGYTSSQLVIAFFCACAALASITAGIRADRRSLTPASLRESLTEKGSFFGWIGGLFLILCWGWLLAFVPTYLVNPYLALSERLRPFSIALALAALELLAVLIFVPTWSAIRPELRAAFARHRRAVGFTFGAAALLALFIGLTRVGLVLDTAYWNVPGIPLSGLQTFVLAAAFLICAYLLYRLTSPRLAWMERLVPVVLFLVAFALWGSTPMLKHFFSLTPTPPQNQPYPYSDARIHDLGGISILMGKGIYFQNYTDKPLYMVFLAALHAVAGYNYNLIVWLQILFLAWAPAVLYLFGKKFHSPAFGLLLAVGVILQEYNAVVLSYKVASANPRLLLTEMPTWLGMIFFTAVLFLWLRTRKTWLAFLAGGIVGGMSLLRLNPLILIPTVVVYAWVVYRAARVPVVKHLAWFCLGAALLLLPWVIGGVNPQGTPWLVVKFNDVINVRYHQPVNAATPAAPASTPAANPAPNPSAPPASSAVAAPSPRPGGLASNAFLIASHFFHNIADSTLALPDSIVYDDLNRLSQRTYWQDQNNWDGSFPAWQIPLIFANLLMVSFGIGYSWTRWRWAGLTPLVVFLAYAASLSFAMNSGSRYIVPVNWCVFFYYFLAWTLAAQLVARAAGFELPAFFRASPDRPESARRERSAFRAVWVGVIAAACLVPFCNNLLPLLTQPSSTGSQLASAQAQLGVSAQDPSAAAGTVLYPYDDKNGSVTFTLLSGSDTQDYLIADQSSPHALRSGDLVVLRAQPGGDPRSVDQLYLVGAGTPVPIWPTR